MGCSNRCGSCRHKFISNLRFVVWVSCLHFCNLHKSVLVLCHSSMIVFSSSYHPLTVVQVAYKIFWYTKMHDYSLYLFFLMSTSEMSYNLIIWVLLAKSKVDHPKWFLYRVTTIMTYIWCFTIALQVNNKTKHAHRLNYISSCVVYDFRFISRWH